MHPVGVANIFFICQSQWVDRFRKLSEMGAKRERVQTSLRVYKDTFDFLQKAAEAAGVTISDAINNILDDYVAWIKSEEEKPKRK